MVQRTREETKEGRRAYTERKKLAIGRSLIQLCLQEEPLYTLKTGGGA